MKRKLAIVYIYSENVCKLHLAYKNSDSWNLFKIFYTPIRTGKKLDLL